MQGWQSHVLAPHVRCSRNLSSKTRALSAYATAWEITMLTQRSWPPLLQRYIQILASAEPCCVMMCLLVWCCGIEDRRGGMLLCMVMGVSE